MNQFDPVNSKYGAPMGRHTVFDNPRATVTIFKVNMVDGDYDDGGAYWGVGPEPLYCCRGEGLLDFIRASNAIQAEHYFRDQHPDLVINRDDNEIVNSFTRGYLDCAAWAAAPEGSNARFSQRAKLQALQDCQDFIQRCEPLLYSALRYRDAEHLGHDFWLSRTGAGTGFWDRTELREGDLGDRLHAVAQASKSISLYATRGWLYFDI